MMMMMIYIYIHTYIYIMSLYNIYKEFRVKVGVHKGSVLSPLLFVVVMEALPLEFREGLPMELLYADVLPAFAWTK